MNSLRDLFITLGLSVDGASFAEGLAWERGLETAAHAIVSAMESVGEFFVGAIEKTADFGEQMDLIAEKTGVGVEQIQRLAYAAGLSGATADGLRTSLVHLGRAVEEAKGGGENAVKAFSSLGVSMADVRSKSPDQILLLMADRMKQLGPGTVRTAAAMDLLGRSGSDLIPMLGEGSDAIRKLGDEAEAAGVIMSAKAAKAARDFGDNVKRLQNDWAGVRQELAGPLIEALDPVVQLIHAWVIQNRALISVKVKEFANGVVVVVSALARGVLALGKALAWVIENWKLFAAVLTGVVLAALEMNSAAIAAMIIEYGALGVAAVLAGLKAAAAWLAAVAPFVLLAAALTLAALAAEDLYYFLTGGDSVIGEIVEDWRGLLARLATAPADNWLVNWLQQQLSILLVIVEIWDRFVEGLGVLGSKLGGLDQGLKSAIANPAALFGSPASDASVGARGGDGGHAARGSGGNFFAPITINQKEGQSAGDVADAVGSKFEQHWESKMREAQRSGGR